MNQLIVVEHDLPISLDLCNIFENRNVSIVKIGGNDANDFSNINLTGLNIDTLLCSSVFEKNWWSRKIN